MTAKIRESIINIFSAIVTLKDLDSGVELIFNHGKKGLKVRKNLIFTVHRIDPRVTRKVICKQDIIAITSDREDGRHPYVRVN